MTNDINAFAEEAFASLTNTTFDDLIRSSAQLQNQEKKETQENHSEQKEKEKNENDKKKHVNTTKLSETGSIDPKIKLIVYKFRVIILGNISVGKTCIWNKFIFNKYSKDYKCSVGVEMKVKNLNISQSSIAELKIWDTCGDEKYRAITRQYYKDADGIILVYDITKQSSFDSLESWLEEIKNNGPDYAEIILVGNKTDLTDQRVIQIEAAEKFAQNKKLSFIEVSAKTGRNVTLLFEKLTNKLIQNFKEREKNNKHKPNEMNNSVKLKPNLNVKVPSKEAEKAEKKTSCC